VRTNCMEQAGPRAQLDAVHTWCAALHATSFTLTCLRVGRAGTGNTHTNTQVETDCVCNLCDLQDW
jgi:hypothetical protein